MNRLNSQNKRTISLLVLLGRRISEERTDGMVGVLIVSHGAFCQEILNSSAMVAGPMRQSGAAALQPGDEPEAYQEEIEAAIRALDTGFGVLVLADLRGGTPYNRTVALVRALKLNAKVVAGVNLGMVLALHLERGEESTLSQLAALAACAGREGVYAVDEMEYGSSLDFDDLEVDE